MKILSVHGGEVPRSEDKALARAHTPVPEEHHPPPEDEFLVHPPPETSSPNHLQMPH
jgi:hypothetical protein